MAGKKFDPRQCNYLSDVVPLKAGAMPPSSRATSESKGKRKVHGAKPMKSAGKGAGGY